MDKTNSKILLVSFAAAAGLLSLTLSLLLKAFAGAFGVVARFTDSDIVSHGLPALVGIGLFFTLQFHPKVRVWADDVVTEIRKVVWPSSKDTTAMTIAVVVMVLISAVIITSFDFIAGYLITKLMQ